MSLNHIDGGNNPTMVDVSQKTIGKRTAHARGIVRLPHEVWQELKEGDIHTKKGPIFHTAIIAGTMGAKKTHELIPFCHPLAMEACKIRLTVQEELLIIDCHVGLTGRTGVEMEALTGASIAALTVFDMAKAISHKIIIEQIKLVEKTGGKRTMKDGDYVAK